MKQILLILLAIVLVPVCLPILIPFVIILICFGIAVVLSALAAVLLPVFLVTIFWALLSLILFVGNCLIGVFSIKKERNSPTLTLIWRRVKDQKFSQESEKSEENLDLSKSQLSEQKGLNLRF